jgi:two-component system, sensor histidine kinase
MDQSVVLANRLRAEQVAALFQHVTLGVIGAASGALVLAGAMIHLGALDWIKGASWISYIFACAAAHLLLRYLYKRAKPDDDQWKIWATPFTVISLAEGVGWGWASVSLVGNSDRFSLEMLVMVVTLNIAGGAIPAFGSYLPTFFALFLPTTIPSVFWSIASRDLFPEAIPMLLLMVIFITAMGGLGIRANQSFKELVGLRIRTNELAKDLRKQKEFAEQANLAKSSFLAAATICANRFMRSVYLLAHCGRSRCLQKGFALSSRSKNPQMPWTAFSARYWIFPGSMPESSTCGRKLSPSSRCSIEFAKTMP